MQMLTLPSTELLAALPLQQQSIQGPDPVALPRSLFTPDLHALQPSCPPPLPYSSLPHYSLTVMSSLWLMASTSSAGGFSSLVRV
jgi:hypothetical protein